MKTYIEIGVCDFDFRYPDDNSRVIYCEPIPRFIESLKNQIIHHNAIFEPSAISNYRGSAVLKTVVNGIEKWVDGISHMSNAPSSNLIDLNQQNGHNIGEIRSIEVRCLTLTDVIKKYNVVDIEVLKIDVEGHEVQVLEGYDWSVMPKHIMLEHKFINKNDIAQMLKLKGYRCFFDSEDLFAIL